MKEKIIKMVKKNHDQQENEVIQLVVKRKHTKREANFLKKQEREGEGEREIKKLKNNFYIIQIIQKNLLMFILIKIQVIQFQLSTQQ